MFDRGLRAEERKASSERGLVWRLMLAVGVAGMTALIASGLLMSGEPTLSGQLDDLEEEVQRALVLLVRAPAQDGATELRNARRALRRRATRLDRSVRAMQAGVPETEDEQALRARAETTQKELNRLLQSLEAWQEPARLAREPLREEAWETVIVEALRERTRWPISGVIRHRDRPRPRDVWREYLQGVGIGAFWPFWGTYNVVRRQPATLGIVRRALFPYGPGAPFGAPHIVGVGTASIAIGYGFCWLGMRYNRASASYAGLLYFVYMFVFGLSLILLKAGLIA